MSLVFSGIITALKSTVVIPSINEKNLGGAFTAFFVWILETLLKSLMVPVVQSLPSSPSCMPKEE